MDIEFLLPRIDPPLAAVAKNVTSCCTSWLAGVALHARAMEAGHAMPPVAPAGAHPTTLRATAAHAGDGHSHLGMPTQPP
jgi:hypothetical protein